MIPFPGCKKGQVLSTELVLSVTLFLAAMVVFLFAWNTISNSYNQAQSDRQMEVVLVSISDTLALSPGDPADWEVGAGENANMFGLAQSQNVLSPQKLAALQSLNSSYDTLRERMGAGQFQMFISARYADSAESTPLPGMGVPAKAGDSTVSSLTAERLALLDGRIAVLRVQLWKGKTG